MSTLRSATSPKLVQLAEVRRQRERLFGSPQWPGPQAPKPRAAVLAYVSPLGRDAMSCREVSFSHACCRIEVHRLNGPSIESAFTATMSVVDQNDDGGRVSRPLLFADGRHIRIHGPTEELTVNTAMSFLGTRFGALSETEHVCTTDVRLGEPVLLAH